MSTVPLSIIIPTHNEELNLPDCLRSLAGWADEVWIVDSYSTDRTLEIAREFGAQVVQRVYDGPATQKNWALDNLAFRNAWILILDADERLTPELRDEISCIVTAGESANNGYYINRRFMFYGKWIRHCGWYPSWNLRLFRRGHGRYEERRIHEHLLLDGRAGYCRHDMIHEDRRDISFWIQKHDRYSTHEAWENLQTLRGMEQSGVRPSFFGNAIERKRAIRDRVWIRLPALVRSLLFFVYMYVFRLGFLDGVQGLHFCHMHAVYQFFYAIKLWELKHYKEGAPEGGINTGKAADEKVEQAAAPR